MTQTTHYYPYGGTLTHSTNQGVQKYKYNGKEFDRTHGLDWYDYCARQYDPASGRFTSMDPLCEKYYNISPYSYCAGNPIRYVDPDGRRIKPIGSQAQNIILSTLSEYERPYVSVNEDGYIDSELLLSCNSHSNNFTCLKDLVMSPYNIEVSTNEIMNYIGGTEEFKEIEYVKGTDIFGNSFEDVNFNDVSGNVDGATGRLGVTYMPVGENETGKAPLDNSSIQININPHLGNSRTAAETFAHEGYGHAIMYVRTGDRSKAVHNPDKKKNKDVELNIELKNAIILGRKEAVDNFNSY